MPLAKHKVFRLAKGFRGRAKNCITIARRRVDKALQYSYRDRRNKKRDVRKDWITQISSGVEQYGLKYSHFMNAMTRSGVQLNRKMLAELAQNEPYSFRAVVDFVNNYTVKDLHQKNTFLHKGWSEFPVSPEAHKPFDIEPFLEKLRAEEAATDERIAAVEREKLD